LITSKNAEPNDSDLTHADILPEAQSTLADVALARRVHDELTGESKVQGGPNLANLDFTVAEFFEAYANAIEDVEPRWGVLETATTPAARQILLDTLTYFENPSGNIRLWPQKGLYVFAMLTSIEVASSALGVTEDDLKRALQQREPNFSWAQWRAFGLAILADVPNNAIRHEFNLSAMTVYKWRRILTGTTSPGRQAA
jgi:hypothetical protein